MNQRPAGPGGLSVRKMPDSRGPTGDSVGWRDIRRIDVYEVNVLGDDGWRNRPAVGCERVVRRNNRGDPQPEQCFASQLRRRE